MLKFDTVNTIQTLLLSSSLFAFLGLIHIKAYRVLRPELVFTTLFTLLGIVMNAMVTAGLNAPCDRFQARVAWLFPMILFIVLVSHWKELKSQASRFRER